MATTTSAVAGWAVGDKAWVHAFGDWRTGYVVKPGRTRLRVRYVSRRDGTAQREQWFPADQVHDGDLPASKSWYCGPCGYAMHGAPGATVDQIRDGHNAQRHPAPAGPVYDPQRDLYVDPATGREDDHARRLRQIEESSTAAMWGER